MRYEAGTGRLEVGVFPTHRLTFASRTHYDKGTLHIGCAALLATIAEPHAIGQIAVQLAHPGESCRIVHVLDAVAPMVKTSGRSTVYPGFFGTTVPAGSGRNHSLQGIAILVCATSPEPTSGALSPHEAIIDMSGPAAPYCAFSDTAKCRPGLLPSFRSDQCRIRRRSAACQAESCSLSGACHSRFSATVCGNL